LDELELELEDELLFDEDEELEDDDPTLLLLSSLVSFFLDSFACSIFFSFS